MKEIIIKDKEILLNEDGSLPCHLPYKIPENRMGVFQFGEYRVWDISNEELPLPEGYIWTGVRESWKHIGVEEWQRVSKGVELVNWNREEKYCRTCGGRLEYSTGISKLCRGCGAEWFAPMTPAVMVLVEDEEGRILLAHNAQFRGNFYSIIAGFVETGETLEECVAREVKEETGLDVYDIRYVESQSWCFPHQLMIGFHARTHGGEIIFADGELTDGGFYERDRLPELPGMPSLARKLIDRWLTSSYS